MRNVGKYIKLNSHHMLEITTDQGSSIGHGRLPAACEDLGKVCAFFKKKKIQTCMELIRSSVVNEEGCRNSSSITIMEQP